MGSGGRGTRAASNTWWPRTPHTKHVAIILADGKPHTHEEIIAKVSPLILDGTAWRIAERSRTRAIQKRVAAGERVVDETAKRLRGDDQTAIRSGKKKLIGDSLDSAVDRGRVKMWDDEQGQRWYQLNPNIRIGFLEKKQRSEPMRVDPEPEEPAVSEKDAGSQTLTDEIREQVDQLRTPKGVDVDKDGETLEFWKIRARSAERQMRQLRRLATKMLAIIDELEDE